MNVAELAVEVERMVADRWADELAAMASDGIPMAEGFFGILGRLCSFSRWVGRKCECSMGDVEIKLRCRRCQKLKYAKPCGFCLKCQMRGGL